MSRNPISAPAGAPWPFPPMTGKMPPVAPFMPLGFIPPPAGFKMPPFVAPTIFPPFGAAAGPTGSNFPAVPMPGVIPPIAVHPASTSPSQHSLLSSPSSLTETPSKPTEDPIWSEHTTDSGQVYWYNRITEQSVWDKPDELKSEIEKQETTKWREYLDDEGRKYYFNAETNKTQWELPPDYKEYLDRIEQKKRKAIEEKETPIEKLLKTIFPEEPLKNAFARCLIDRNMASNWTWDQCVNSTFEDERSKALKMAERKQVYQLMIQKLRPFEIEQKKKKERQIEDDFFTMLEEWKEFDKYTTWRECADKFKDDARYLAVNSERDRSKLFHDFRDAKERKAREIARNILNKKIESFKQYLKDAKVTSTTTWKEFKEDHEADPVFQALEPLDRLTAFSDYIRVLERKEDDILAAERAKIRTNSRKARENFRKLLVEKHALGQIDLNTTWSSFFPKIITDPRYASMLNITGSTPAELFYDFVLDLEDKYLREKRKVKAVAKALNLRVLKFDTPHHVMDDNKEAKKESTQLNSHKHIRMPVNILSLSFEEAPKTSFAEWKSQVLAEIPSADENELTQIYQEFGERELEKIQRRVKRAQKYFGEFLEDVVKAGTTFQSVQSQALAIPDFDQLPIEYMEQTYTSYLNTHQEITSGQPVEEVDSLRSSAKRQREEDDQNVEPRKQAKVLEDTVPLPPHLVNRAPEEPEEGEL